MSAEAEPAPAPSAGKSSPGRAGYLVLAVAVLAALGVGAFLFVSGRSNDSEPTPVATVENVLAAIGKGDQQAVAGLVVPDQLDDPTVRLGPVTFADIAASKGYAIAGAKARLIANQAGWATVGVRGKVTGPDGSGDLAETLYLQQQPDGRWLISSQLAFTRAFSGQGDSGAKSASNGLGPLEPRRPKLDEAAPDFALIDARDGATVRKLSDYKGKAVIVNWYASWCGPCKSEIPDFQEAVDALGGDLVVLGVDYLESQDRAKGILDVLYAKYPAVMDSEALVADQWRVGSGLPTTFFVDKDGILRAMKTGRVTPDELEKYLGKLGLSYSAK